MAPKRVTKTKSNPKASKTTPLSPEEPEPSSSAPIDPKIASSEIWNPIILSTKAQGKRPAQQEPEGSNKRATVAASGSSSLEATKTLLQ